MARLDELSKIWKSTLQLSNTNGHATEILQHVLRIIDSISATRKEVASRRAQVFEPAEPLIRAGGQNSNSFSFCRAIRRPRNAVRDFFVKIADQSGTRKSVYMKSGQSTVASCFPPQLKRIDCIRQAPALHLPGQPIIILVLVIAVHWLRRRVQKWSKREPSLQRVAPLFDLSVSTGLVFSCVISRRFSTHRHLACSWQSLELLSLIPTVLILRRLIDQKFVSNPQRVGVMYFVDQVRVITAAMPLLGPVVFGAEMLGGTLFLIWLIRSKHFPTIGANTTKRFARAIRVATQIGLIVFPATLLANVFGYVNLANLLGNGALRSAYVAAALYAALRIVEGLIIISLAARPLGLMRVVRLNRPMLQRRICGVAEFLAFLWWLNLALNFFELRAPLIDEYRNGTPGEPDNRLPEHFFGTGHWCLRSRFGHLS